MDARKKELIRAYKEQPPTAGICLIQNSQNGRWLLLGVANPQGSKNRFHFSQATGSCVYPQLQADWKEQGGGVFSFEILEQITQKEAQTAREFSEELEVLCALWREKFDPALSY